MNDSDLYSGVHVEEENTIGNENPVDEVREEIDKNEELMARLNNHKAELKAMIDVERRTMQSFHAYLAKLGEKAKGEDIQAEFRARELYLGYLDHLEAVINGTTDTRS